VVGTIGQYSRADEHYINNRTQQKEKTETSNIRQMILGVCRCMNSAHLHHGKSRGEAPVIEFNKGCEIQTKNIKSILHDKK
jgi:hypothetical protein